MAAAVSAREGAVSWEGPLWRLAGRTEDPIQRILVVADRNNKLEDKLAGTSYIRATRADICVLAAKSRILLMNADGIRNPDGLAIMRAAHPVEVGDHAEAVAAELEVVGGLAGAAFAEVEGGFAVQRSAGVACDRCTRQR